MLKRLRQYKLYIKLSKYEFSIISVIFFKFVINIGGIEIDINKIEIIIEWPKSKFFRNIQIFLNFANFYRHFIKDYSRIAKAKSMMCVMVVFYLEVAQRKGFDGVRTGHIGHVIYQGSSAGQFHNTYRSPVDFYIQK
jgi:hypothetical protein